MKMGRSDACLMVAAAQMVSTPRVADNLASAERLLELAADSGARLVVLPEYFALISADAREKVRLRERFGAGPIQDWLARQAARLGLWIVGGTVPLEADVPDKVRNACLVHAPDGRCVARYDKIHLFGLRHGEEVYDEGETIEPGEAVVTVDIEGWTVGLSICYDLRFPELYRAMGLVDLIVLPAAFTWTTGRAHWEVLLRARAIENQCYVLAAAQGGRHEAGRRTWGDSLVVDPWGEVCVRLAEGEGVVRGTLRRERLDEVRARLPAWQHRREGSFIRRVYA